MGRFGPCRLLWILCRRRGRGIHRCGHRFVRQRERVAQTRQVQEKPGSSESPALLGGHTNAGDAVTVSVDTVAGEPAKVTGARTGVRTGAGPTGIPVGVDHEVSVDGILKRVGKIGVASDVVFGIDRDEIFAGKGRIRNNHAQMFYAEGTGGGLSWWLICSGRCLRRVATPASSSCPGLNPN